MTMISPDCDDLIAFLNSLVSIDEYAIAELLCVRVPCNEAMADHPTVQVAGAGPGTTFVRPGTFRLGLLGLLNGYCGIGPDGWGPIAAIYERGRLVRFERTGSST